MKIKTNSLEEILKLKDFLCDLSEEALNFFKNYNETYMLSSCKSLYKDESIVIRKEYVYDKSDDYYVYDGFKIKLVLFVNELWINDKSLISLFKDYNLNKSLWHTCTEMKNIFSQFRDIFSLERHEIMEIFRDEELINKLTPNDKIEIFLTILQGSSDITVDLLNRLLIEYSVNNIIIEKLKQNNGKV